MESDRTLSALGNEYNPDILRAADEPHSAQEFSEMLDIPIATCYRRIEELTAAGLLELHDRVLSDEHRRTNVYRREVDEIVVRFEDDDYTVSVTERPEVKNKLDDVWRKITQD
ncbi:ArsR family transcriptional regulator [Haloferax mediterranei ATCC 33500]|uniref:ArsR family transcriptional regulator n=1 Tax=Haloferax mediterranei (strain ATCC 33500 / DSM 1411 / JCM 8866 / NBRC 14739 / NCIMB 2177 / R-4) TaxID=523841 RepID=I3R3X1_HALMT|nr:helix-turn-helix domain-containing protein [Haloferax mediterranei]AFK18931.1 putative transcriptional regulator, ArsR family [Haloferax mediterranei ATCC 33500]AHZ21706.1 ArsR family transcriptional regulator [Haloferax mediterranei ATCC 33500]EMA03210.1 ArsR family transcriptional regulator [Haloferax mediterranei ATCC 33500]MDX5989024.1 helix-turn-helix domain-containing protein [Haloferax mediterranei ATCC 33500]QCQ75417.1 ArsR family transcriptional regulator [Haloferax mediterranei AT